ncbi:MAG: aminoglycoside phosphotransferase family protein, partial [Methylosarcina sp.]
LFDKCNKKAIGLIDLDTVKPGLLHYDIGDALRSCCLAPETGEFDPEIAAAILAGYLAEAAGFFTEPDYDYLYPAIRLIPFELGLRFYTDFLEGDRYFKVSSPGQNLHRAVEQFGLCRSIIKQEHKIKKIINDFRRKASG